jgi:hypothetical protein
MPAASPSGSRRRFVLASRSSFSSYLNLDYGMLAELNSTGLVDSVLGAGTKQGYMFQAAYSVSPSELLWFNLANPTIAGTTGDRYFDTNQAGVIFYTSGTTLAIDTSTCVLPTNAERSADKFVQSALIPTGK